MLKQNKWKLLATSLIILVPILVGLVLWPKLPDTMPTHFGLDGTADGWNGKGFGVFGLPLILLGAHHLCLHTRHQDQHAVYLHMFGGNHGDCSGKLSAQGAAELHIWPQTAMDVA